MTRFGHKALAVGLLCLAGAGWTALRAGEETAAATPTVSDLLARISQLEKRIAVLEERDSRPRLVNAEVPAGGPPRLTDTPKGVEPVEPAAPGRPSARIWLLRQSAERK